MQKTYWTVVGIDGLEVNAIFVTKTAATAWIAEQPVPENYTIKKHSMV